MCSMECVGDQYRGCGHYVRVYQTGVTTDCGSPACKLSSAHMHRTARNCGCNAVYTDNRRVRNLFQTKCDECQYYAESVLNAQHRSSGRHW